jgi:acetylornithine/succinyldiaminopimelate/putrescine aminotransferase
MTQEQLLANINSHLTKISQVFSQNSSALAREYAMNFARNDISDLINAYLTQEQPVKKTINTKPDENK